ncbi:hypothetical protein BP5796_12634 [Coleophoma crateriformis]|uniref:Choline monooxygenase, chloroplastic n=1 Tax=Coleophoma crateriformis TaxID=565419 RepID=A0A3D8Q7N1_9HELO|nr:hypothetical protein BP5796_12634 [Coleophoma crateriformis]
MQSWFLLGAVTKWPSVGEDYCYDLAQVRFTVRRTSVDWQSLKIFSDSDGSEMRTHLSPTGLLFTTLSNETVSFEKFFPGLEDLISHMDCTELPLRRPLEYICDYNWKTMVDGYQECLHCAYAHPEFSKVYTSSTYKVLNKHNYSQHIAKPDEPSDGLFIYLFPNCTLSFYGGGMTSWRICPSEDPTKSMMEFDYYHTSPVGSEEFEKYYKFTRTVALEDLALCTRAQENLNIGIYTEGVLNPNKENGVAYYQGRVLEMCSAQYEEERHALQVSVKLSLDSSSDHHVGGPPLA